MVVDGTPECPARFHNPRGPHDRYNPNSLLRQTTRLFPYDARPWGMFPICSADGVSVQTTPRAPNGAIPGGQQSCETSRSPRWRSDCFC